ncbi:MAG: ATP-dependent sacrificial sulfur transferase LarE [SAR202 cluster bacterium]|nr:ATP-dependent sacrificial sulfur transferase LarE [SAR202 cluster bacterium]|tara:strand:- start:393 stop:1226 length:834 start_codon:yes stop_codon:yes gene_type:complete
MTDQDIVDKALDLKFAALKKLISGYGSLIVAYSGGVDSTLLAAVAHDVLGENSISVTSRSPSVAPEELESAIELARTKGWRHLIVETNEIEDPRYLANDGRRCFFCKTELYTHLAQVAIAEGISKVANGANTDDLGDYRPGMEAANNFEVVSPLVEARMSKQEIRDISKRMALPTWDKPAQPCLSSRIPYGTAVSVNALSMIGKSEKGLRELGFRVVRVRHYGQTARVEIPIDDFERFEHVRFEAEQIVLASGYKAMELDPKGFRSGALNDVLNLSV